LRSRNARTSEKGSYSGFWNISGDEIKGKEGRGKSGEAGLHVVASIVYDNSNEDKRKEDSSGTDGWRFSRMPRSGNGLYSHIVSLRRRDGKEPKAPDRRRGVRTVRELNRGILIAIEGIDGAGKTTQTRLIAEALLKDGFSVVSLKEPTEGRCGIKIRSLANDGRNLNAKEEMMLFLEDRKEDVEENIKPSLAEKKIVIMDRYYLSNIAYQGALGLDINEIRQMNERFAPIPDLVVILDVAPSIGHSRLVNGRREKPNHFENEVYLEKVREQFLKMQHHKNVQVIDGTQPIWDVADSMLNSVRSIIRAVGEVHGTEVAEGSPGIAGA